MDPTKQRLLEQVEGDRDRLIAFLQDFIRCKTPNPPGNVVPAVDFVSKFLGELQLPYRIVAPHPEMPNIVGSFDCGSPGRHLVLNGHTDVFPVESESAWTKDPWGGELSDGRVYGRGACDMKCGTTASIFTYAYLHRIREQLYGRLTLTVVSDEETFGPWGARHLMEHHSDEILGDCCLNGEPSSPYTVRFGERGPLWLTFSAATPGGHGAYVHTSKNAIAIAIDVMQELRGLGDMPVAEAPSLTAALDEASVAMDRAYGAGAAKVIRKVTVNFGKISGGVKVNMIASECQFEVDLRVPNGLNIPALLAEVDRIVAKYPEVSYRVMGGNEPTWCAPDHEMMDHVRNNAQAVSGITPARVVSPGGTDARLWRMKNVPAIVHGPSPTGMGSVDEHVTLDEFFHVVKTHLLSAYDYLSKPGAA